MPKVKTGASTKPANVTAVTGATKAKSSKKSTAPAGTPKLYSSFVALPLDLPSPIPIASTSKVAAAASSSATHYLFIRPHHPKTGAPAEEVSAAARTLFVANVPADAVERDLRTVFTQWGVVESVDIAAEGGGGDVLEQAVRGIENDEDDEDDSDEEDEDEAAPEEEAAARAEPTFVGTGVPKLPRSQRKRRQPNTLPPSVPTVSVLPPLNPRSTPFGASGARSARVIFVDAVSVPRAMSYTSGPIPVPNYGADEPTGLAFFQAQYAATRPALALVKTHADTSLARYDHLHSLLLTSRAKAHGAGALVDEDGFTVVVRGGRYGRTAGRGGDGGGGAGVAVASRTFAAEAANKKLSKGSGPLEDFYQFQKVDRKRKELAELRKKFDEDKKKVEELKHNRRFKPY